MSTALAIASVTWVLKDLLNNRLIDGNITGATGSVVEVSSMPPDSIETGEKEKSLLNLFLYRVTPNIGWSNHLFPSHDSGGVRISNPPLALDLHYLLSAYSSKELHVEILLGYGMQLFHETPVLTREAIRTSLQASAVGDSNLLPETLRAIAESGLAEQVEMIKITPEVINTEEISRLWTAFSSKYRPSAAYKVTVVLIESQRSVKTALPVQNRKIYVNQLRHPVVEKIQSRATINAPVTENQPILSDYFLVIKGVDLFAEHVIVRMGDTDVESDLENVTDTTITLQLPPGLAAGAYPLQVIQQTYMGEPAVLHEGVSSNIQSFIISPVISASGFTDGETDEEGLMSGTITITVTPALKEKQKAVLLLNAFSGTNKNYSFKITVAADSPDLNDVPFSITGVKPGTYLVRMQVDGAESALQTDINGKYIAPQLLIS